MQTLIAGCSQATWWRDADGKIQQFDHSGDPAPLPLPALLLPRCEHTVVAHVPTQLVTGWLRVSLWQAVAASHA